MFNHPFAYVMALTFVGAIAAMVVGMINLSAPRTEATSGAKASRSTALMFWRVGLCFLLLVEIIIYILYIKPGL
jgi:hypothetical protein